MKIRNKIVVFVIIVLLLASSLACFRDNEDALIIEEACRNTPGMECK